MLGAAGSGAVPQTLDDLLDPEFGINNANDDIGYIYYAQCNVKRQADMQESSI